MGTAMNIAGGIILGCTLFAIAIIICFVGIIVKKKKKTYVKGTFINKPAVIMGIIGAVIVLVSVISMAVTSSYHSVSTIFSTISSKSDAIYKNKHYIKTDFVFNGDSGKYKYTDLEDTALTGADKLYTLKNYKSFDILVTQDTNITGSIFVAENEKADFEKEYSDYSNYKTGLVIDKHKGNRTTEKSCSPDLYKKIADMRNYKETKEENVSYADEIEDSKNYIFWATSKDKLISSQIKLYPKDKNGLYILTDSEKYYELDKNIGAEADKAIK